MPMSPIEVIHAVRALLSDPARWTKRDYARDRLGRGCLPTSDQACSWCYVGAFAKVLNMSAGDAEHWRSKNGLHDPTRFNDQASYTDILSRLNEEEKTLTRSRP